MSKKTQKLLSELVDYIYSNEGISQKDLAETFNMKLTKANYYIKQLLSNNLIRRERIREGKTQSYFLYSMNSKVELQNSTSKKDFEIQENKVIHIKDKSIIEKNLVGTIDQLLTKDIEKLILSKEIEDSAMKPERMKSKISNLTSDNNKPPMNDHIPRGPYVESLKHPSIITQKDLEELQMKQVLSHFLEFDKKHYKYIKPGGPLHSQLKKHLHVFNILFNRNNLVESI